jgi:hypothetical protein
LKIITFTTGSEKRTSFDARRRAGSRILDVSTPGANGNATTPGAGDELTERGERPLLRGCIPILCMPCFDDGSLELASLGREIEEVIGAGASGVAALAIASERDKLTEPERDQIVREVVGGVRRRVPVVVSADGAGTEVALERARRAERLGADALMVLPPSFMKSDQSASSTTTRGSGTRSRSR